MRGSDIYVVSRMFGRLAKVSLHASGDGHWAANELWVKSSPGARNRDRYIVRWRFSRPGALEARPIFAVRIPASELRATEEAGLPVALWISAPPPGTALVIWGYLTPPSQSDPAIGAALPGKLLASFPLADGRWFCIVLDVRTSETAEIDALRAQILADARREQPDFVPVEGQRACGFMNFGDDDCKAFIELCLTPPPST